MKKAKMQRVQLLMPADLLERIDAIADTNGLDRSTFIRLVLLGAANIADRPADEQALPLTLAFRGGK